MKKEKQNKEQKPIVEVSKEFIEIPNNERTTKETTTQTQTFESRLLERITNEINKATNLNLEQPTTKAKGTKKVLFKYILLFCLQNLKINESKIKEILQIGKYL